MEINKEMSHIGKWAIPLLKHTVKRGIITIDSGQVGREEVIFWAFLQQGIKQTIH